jgi:all-trans-retinol 13,14-reductase
MAGRSIGIPYKQFHGEGPFDAIVIGSGIGGMATAALLAKAAGQRVLVLERHYTAGGFTHVFHRPGFEWDVGVHYIGQVHESTSQVRALFDYLADGRLAWQAMPDVYDRIAIGGLRFDYVRGEARLREALATAFPRETRAIDRYFRMIRQCIRRLPFFFIEKTLPAIPARILGGPLRAPFLALARHTTAEVLDGIGVSAELKAVLTAQWGNYGLPPSQSSFGIHAIVTSHYFEGGAYPIGGASRIASSLLPTVERSGGALVIGAQVDQVLIEGSSMGLRAGPSTRIKAGHRVTGVRMKDGREFRAGCVVSDAGVRTTLERLLPVDAPADVQRMAARTRELPPSLAHLCLYAGVESNTLSTPLDPANLWIHPRLDFDRNLSEFVADPEAPFPFLFISFPSAKDPSFGERYPGRQTIEVVTLAPYEHFSRWAGTGWHRRGAEYDALKQRIGERLLAELHRHVPAVAGAVVTWELSTPLSTRHFVGAPHGEIYGLAHTPARFASRDLRPRTPIAGLYVTGQDIGTCGVMGALSGAVTTASVVLRRNLFGAIAKAASRRHVTRERTGAAGSTLAADPEGPYETVGPRP